LNITILDQFGKPFTNFENDFFGGKAEITVVKRDLTYLAGTSLLPNQNGSILLQLVFPSDGQYVIFVGFYPRNGKKEVKSIPLTVGSSITSLPALTTDDPPVQTIGDLRIMLKSDQPLLANQLALLRFEVVDAQGQLRQDKIQVWTALRGQVKIVDEKLSTLIQPDFIDRDQLQFSVDFPVPGKYKVWFTVQGPEGLQQVTYVVLVK
jgi:hypothetical protein